MNNMSLISNVRVPSGREQDAAQFLRRHYPNVYRCDADGQADQKGEHWRCGTLTLAPDEMLQRAEAKGFEKSREGTSMEVMPVRRMPGAIANTRDLRAFLVEQMQNVVSGDLDPAIVKSVATLSQQIYNTINIELRVATAKSGMGGTEIPAIEF